MYQDRVVKLKHFEGWLDGQIALGVPVDIPSNFIRRYIERAVATQSVTPTNISIQTREVAVTYHFARTDIYHTDEGMQYLITRCPAMATAQQIKRVIKEATDVD